MKNKRNLVDEGYGSCMTGQPCEAPVAREQDRAAWEQGWRAARRALDAEYQAGRRSAMAEYLKVCRPHPPNPHKAVNSELWRNWHRGWLAGCDEALAAKRSVGECIDV